MSLLAYAGGAVVTYLITRQLAKNEPDVYNSFGLLTLCALVWPLFWAAVTIYWAYVLVTEKS